MRQNKQEACKGEGKELMVEVLRGKGGNAESGQLKEVKAWIEKKAGN
jgi:hypothetical protein